MFFLNKKPRLMTLALLRYEHAVRLIKKFFVLMNVRHCWHLIQTVTYKAAFPDRISDVIEDLNISAAAGIRAGKLSVNGSTAYINESKFKESHINLFVNVKVTNDKLVLNQELVTFNEMKSVIKNSNTFTEHYGDGYISSFISGGGKWELPYLSLLHWLYVINDECQHYSELSAIVNIKLIDPSYLLNVKALWVDSSWTQWLGKCET